MPSGHVKILPQSLARFFFVGSILTPNYAFNGIHTLSPSSRVVAVKETAEGISTKQHRADLIDTSLSSTSPLPTERRSAAK
jgi:hypothetical protein